jgi:hypothetical protein
MSRPPHAPSLDHPNNMSSPPCGILVAIYDAVYNRYLLHSVNSQLFSYVASLCSTSVIFTADVRNTPSRPLYSATQNFAYGRLDIAVWWIR